MQIDAFSRCRIVCYGNNTRFRSEKNAAFAASVSGSKTAFALQKIRFVRSYTTMNDSDSSRMTYCEREEEGLPKIPAKSFSTEPIAVSLPPSLSHTQNVLPSIISSCLAASLFISDKLVFFITDAPFRICTHAWMDFHNLPFWKWLYRKSSRK